MCFTFGPIAMEFLRLRRDTDIGVSGPTSFTTFMSVDLPTGVSLEIDLLQPLRQQNERNKLAILLHPWSRLGGQMHDP